MSLQISEDEQVSEFLQALIESNPQAARSLQTSMATITSVDHYANERKFKRVAKGIYEIKIPGIRLYCFKDEIEAPQERIPKLIVATNGGTKNTAREQQRDIDRAQEIRDRYLHAKSDPDTTLNYVTVNDED